MKTIYSFKVYQMRSIYRCVILYHIPLTTYLSADFPVYPSYREEEWQRREGEGSWMI